jgi:siroheme synthase
MSGHRCLGKQVKWAAVIATGATVVVYMPGSNYSRLSRELITAGASAGLPCLVVSNATRAEQQAVSGTVGTLSDIAPLTAPSLLIIGEVAGKAHSDIGRAEQSATQVRLEGDRMVWVD